MVIQKILTALIIYLPLCLSYSEFWPGLVSLCSSKFCAHNYYSFVLQVTGYWWLNPLILKNEYEVIDGSE